jgi:hypothetical protein
MPPAFSPARHLSVGVSGFGFGFRVSVSGFGFRVSGMGAGFVGEEALHTGYRCQGAGV